MKSRIFLAFAAVAALVACGPATDIDLTESCSFEQDTDHVEFSLAVELPAGGNAASAAVRSYLLDILCRETSDLGFYEEPLAIPAIADDGADIDTIVSYYGSEAVKHLEKLASADAAERAEAGFSEDDFPGYECDCHLQRVFTSSKCWVYVSSNYVYLGGAHGGVTGSGYMTFKKADGSLLSGIIDSSHTEAMQPLIIKGLMDYFAEEVKTEEELFGYLFVEQGDIIPLPSYEPFPNEDGLNFVYQQYEIAPYAAGMPGFSIPWGDVAPFLSAEAAEILL